MKTQHPSRRGSVYVLVIIAMAIAGAAVISSLEIANARNSEAAFVTESAQARHYAHTAIEHGFAVIAKDPTWRWSRGDGYWEKDVVTDRGTLDLSVTGINGNALSQDAWDSATLTGVGRVNDSRSMIEVQIGIQGEGVPNVGEVVFSNTGLAIWPFEGDSSQVKAEQVQGNLAVITDGSSPFHTSAIPGLGASTAPWFSDSSYAKMGIGTGYESIRTISFWFWAESIESYQGLVVRDALSAAKGSWALHINSGMLTAMVKTGSWYVDVDVAVQAKRWYHVAFTLEDGAIVLYLNGVDSARQSLSTIGYWDASSNAENIYVGISHSFSFPGSATVSRPFTGSICQVVLMGEPLSAIEVQQLYDGYPAPAQYKVLIDTWNRVSD